LFRELRGESDPSSGCGRERFIAVHRRSSLADFLCSLQATGPYAEDHLVMKSPALAHPAKSSLAGENEKEQRHSELSPVERIPLPGTGLSR
jgi:hypothetical protein